MDHIEAPAIPKDAQKKIAHLQEEFIRAEVEQRMSNPPFFPFHSFLPRRVTRYGERAICTTTRPYGEEEEEKKNSAIVLSLNGNAIMESISDALCLKLNPG
jgi:hypothetical protein